MALETTNKDTIQNLPLDDYREKMRRKWDEETKLLLEKEHGQSHYSNVRFDGM